jgi:hypothetical protein
MDPVRSISFTTTNTSSSSDLRSGGASVSFVIQGAGGGQSRTDPSLRLDQIDSRTVIGRARSIYLTYMTRGFPGGEPMGVVLLEHNPQTPSGRSSEGAGLGGRVVFECPVLLPNEIYVPLEWLRGRGSRGRGPRSPQRT